MSNRKIWLSDALKALVDTEEIKGYAYTAMEERLKACPEADRPSGEWLRELGTYSNGYPRFVYHCSRCGFREEHAYASSKCSNFCPNCGARMKGADDE